MKNTDPKNWIVILGSGTSVNDLPLELKNWVNNTDVRLGLNKFGNFYEQSGITPTDIYFQDFHDENARHFLNWNLRKTRNICEKFFLNADFKKFVAQNYFTYSLKVLKYHLLKKRTLYIKILRKTLKIINKRHYDVLALKLLRVRNYEPVLMRSRNNLFFLRTYKTNDSENTWANSLDEKLYHFRGSLTTSLNVVSILYPKQPILMLGVDLVKSGYFFQKELDDHYARFGKGYDWTYQHMVNKGKHFTALEHQECTIFDAFDYVTQSLGQTENDLYAYPKQNATIFDGKVKYFDLLDL